jgi:hypothetical protein
MTNQFEFKTEDSVNVLNFISKEIANYERHEKDLAEIGTDAAYQLIKMNTGRIEAYRNIHQFLTDYFKVCGLEIYSLEAEEVEPQTEVTKSDLFGNIMLNAFSHFSK